MSTTAGSIKATSSSLYIDLLKKILMNTIYRDPHLGPWGNQVFDPNARTLGKDWPREAHTMVGADRLNNLEACVRDIVENNIEGDLIETGVWRGGCSILMRAVLKEYAVTDRTVWVADSFQGLPPPDPERFPADSEWHLEVYKELAVSLDQVRDHFQRYGLLDDQVRFLPGWFRDTLPAAPIERLALLRLDGDLYESTYVALETLYPKLSCGGYVIVDDYGALEPCRLATDDYRRQHKIDEEIMPIDWTGVWWKKRRRD